MEIEQSFLDDPDASLTMTDVRRWIGEAKREGAAAERTNIRGEILAAIDPEIRMHRIAGSSVEVEVVLVSWLKAELDRICPEE